MELSFSPEILSVRWLLAFSRSWSLFITCFGLFVTCFGLFVTCFGLFVTCFGKFVTCFGGYHPCSTFASSTIVTNKTMRVRQAVSDPTFIQCAMFAVRVCPVWFARPRHPTPRVVRSPFIQHAVHALHLNYVSTSFSTTWALVRTTWALVRTTWACMGHMCLHLNTAVTCLDLDHMDTGLDHVGTTRVFIFFWTAYEHLCMEHGNAGRQSSTRVG
jgi:hypothetical protein